MKRFGDTFFSYPIVNGDFKTCFAREVMCYNHFPAHPVVSVMKAFHSILKVKSRNRVSFLTVSQDVLFDDFFMNSSIRGNNINLVVSGCVDSQSLHFAVKKLKSRGCNVWRDYNGGRVPSGELFDGIRVNRELTWCEKTESLCSIVMSCRNEAKQVILDGVDDDYYMHLARISGADYFQGLMWPPEYSYG